MEDHLGNTRVVFSDDETGNAQEVQKNEYYAFGLAFESQQNTYGYTFGHKEEQNELGLEWLDFGARCLARDIGRWTAIDPLAEKFKNLSPYNYAFNSPIIYNDPTGTTPVLINDRPEFIKPSTSLTEGGSHVLGSSGVLDSDAISSGQLSADTETVYSSGNNDSNWQGMTKKDLMGLSKGVSASIKEKYPDKTSIERNNLVTQEMGRRLETAILESIRLPKNTKSYGSNDRIPDGVVGYGYFNHIVAGVSLDDIHSFIEIKSGKNISIEGQIMDYLTYLGNSRERLRGQPVILHMVTLSDASLDWQSLEKEAIRLGVGLFHSQVEVHKEYADRIRMGTIQRRVEPVITHWNFTGIYNRLRKGTANIGTGPMY